MHYYAPSTLGFYDDSIHGSRLVAVQQEDGSLKNEANPACMIPVDAIEISAEEHASMLAGQSAGKIIATASNGAPVLLDPPPLAIQEVQAHRREAIKAERDRRIQAGGYMVGSHWFHSDTFSRTQQMGLVMLGAALPAGVEWKTMGGAKVLMTQALAQQIFATAAASDIAIFAAAEAHMAAMLASADAATYDFAGGWPPAFGE